MSRFTSVDRKVYDTTIQQNRITIEKMRETDESISLRIRAESVSQVPEPPSQRVADILAKGDPEGLLRR